MNLEDSIHGWVDCGDGELEAIMGRKGRVVILAPNGQWAEVENGETGLKPLESEDATRLDIPEGKWCDLRVAMAVLVTESRLRRRDDDPA